MDLAQFRDSLQHALAALESVEDTDFKNEAFVFKCRAILEQGLFLQVCFNERTATTAFALTVEGEYGDWISTT